MVDVNVELDALTARADAAREAEENSRREFSKARGLLEAKRVALTQAHTSGDDALIKSARTAFERCERDAGASTHAARIEGERERVRLAELAVSAFMNENYVALIEALRPRAEASVSEIRRRAGELVNAVTEWHLISQEICAATRHLQWFDPRERMPRDPFGGLLGMLDEFAHSEVPAPMPLSLEPPGEQPAEQDADRAAPVDHATAQWAA